MCKWWIDLNFVTRIIGILSSDSNVVAALADGYIYIYRIFCKHYHFELEEISLLKSSVLRLDRHHSLISKRWQLLIWQQNMDIWVISPHSKMLSCWDFQFNFKRYTRHVVTWFYCNTMAFKRSATLHSWIETCVGNVRITYLQVKERASFVLVYPVVIAADYLYIKTNLSGCS